MSLHLKNLKQFKRYQSNLKNPKKSFDCEKEIEKIRKKQVEFETRIDNVVARLIRLELKK